MEFLQAQTKSVVAAIPVKEGMLFSQGQSSRNGQDTIMVPCAEDCAPVHSSYGSSREKGLKAVSWAGMKTPEDWTLVGVALSWEDGIY